MAQPRTLLVTALCALALPTAALADSTTGAQNANANANANAGSAATENSACDYEHVCAQRAQAATQQRAAQGARHARRHVVKSERMALANPNAGLVTQHVDTRISRDVGNNCIYVSDAQGVYGTKDASGRDQDALLRHLDVRANASLACNGNVVRRTTHRFVFPATTRRDFAELMNARMETQVPGSACQWGSKFSFAGGELRSRGVEGNCSANQSVAALSSYLNEPGANANGVAGVDRGFGTSVNVRRGGGPAREPTSWDARPGVR